MTPHPTVLRLLVVSPLHTQNGAEFTCCLSHPPRLSSLRRHGLFLSKFHFEKRQNYRTPRAQCSERPWARPWHRLPTEQAGTRSRHAHGPVHTRLLAPSLQRTPGGVCYSTKGHPHTWHFHLELFQCPHFPILTFIESSPTSPRRRQGSPACHNPLRQSPGCPLDADAHSTSIIVQNAPFNSFP